ncbi:MAG: hypothetical protein RL196_26 [Actinomycetota bacterium]|jgi:hypothetical protein
MIAVQRWVAAVTALGFGLYHPLLGSILLLQNTYHEPRLVQIALALYVLALIPSVTMYAGVRMPRSQALANLFAVLSVPLLMQAQLGLDQRGYATWYVAGLATLMTVTAVRQHIIIAWCGLIVLWSEVLIWHGPDFIVDSGLIGAFLLVAAGTGLAVGLANTDKAAEDYAQEAASTAAKSAAKSAARAVRQTRVQEALRGTLPMLRKIVVQNGELSSFEKEEARLLEAELRDEIVGRDLIDALVRDAAREARRRGAHVTIFDDGSLEGIDSAVVEKMRFKIAQVINATASGKITVRAPKGEKWLVTIVVSQPGADVADLFLKLPEDL